KTLAGPSGRPPTVTLFLVRTSVSTSTTLSRPRPAHGPGHGTAPGRRGQPGRVRCYRAGPEPEGAPGISFGTTAKTAVTCDPDGPETALTRSAIPRTSQRPWPGW